MLAHALVGADTETLAGAEDSTLLAADPLPPSTTAHATVGTDRAVPNAAATIPRLATAVATPTAPQAVAELGRVIGRLGEAELHAACLMLGVAMLNRAGLKTETASSRRVMLGRVMPTGGPSWLKTAFSSTADAAETGTLTTGPADAAKPLQDLVVAGVEGSQDLNRESE